MTVTELYRRLEERIPPSLSCEWDHDGLMCCPEPSRQASKVLLTLDVTEEAAAYAAENGFDVILSHHPMIFRPLPALVLPKLIRLVRDGITVMSFHTRLDRLDGGVNTVLAERLGLTDAVPFSEEGIGLIGTLEEPADPAVFANRVKAALGCPFLEWVEAPRLCSRVAVVGGDGKDCLSDAVRAGCDTYLTGSMSYNAMTDAAELGIHVMTAGHYFTENPVLDRLRGMLEEIDGSIVSERFECNLIRQL